MFPKTLSNTSGEADVYENSTKSASVLRGKTCLPILLANTYTNKQHARLPPLIVLCSHGISESRDIMLWPSSAFHKIVLGTYSVVNGKSTRNKKVLKYCLKTFKMCFFKLTHEFILIISSNCAYDSPSLLISRRSFKIFPWPRTSHK